MKKIFTIYLLAQSLFSTAQGLVNNGATIKVSNGTTVRVDNGSIENKNTGNIDNSGNIYLDNNFNQTTGATYTASAASWLWFEGTANQNASGDAPLNIPKLRVDNGNKLILNNSVNVSNRVDLTNNGTIELGVHNLILTSGAVITGYDVNHYVITNSTGYLQQEVTAVNVVFPVGRSSYNPATINNTGTTDNFQIRIEDIVYDQGTTGTPELTGVVNRSWHITESVLGGSVSDITLEWDQIEELVFDRTSCGVAHWNGSVWEHEPLMAAASNVAATRWNRTRTGQTTFSPFVVEDLNEDLPVELLYFNAVRKDISTVKLDWSTASELNNQGFDIERMLDSETEFTKIAWVDGNGTTTNTSYYNLLDPNGYEGISYYRLKQIDFDGTFSYSDIRAVSGWKSEGNSIDVFPNPIHDYINIRLTSECKEISLRLIDAKGALILSKVKSVPVDKMVVLNELEDLAEGAYILIITTDTGEILSKKLVKKQR